MAEQLSDGEMLEEHGVSGLKYNHGTVDDEMLKELRYERNRWKIYREMSENEPVLGAVLLAIQTLTRQVDWHIEPFQETSLSIPTSEDLVAARFVETALQDLDKPFPDVIQEIMSYLVFGWSYHTIVLKQRNGFKPPNFIIPPDFNPVTGSVIATREWSSDFDDGMFGWAKIAPRAQETLNNWIFTDKGDLAGMNQTDPNTFKHNPIWINKALHFRTQGGHNNNPLGRSILRTAYRPWYMKKKIENIQAIGIERDLTGLPIIHVPEDIMRINASAANVALRKDLEKLVRNIRRGDQEGALIPRRSRGSEGGEDLYRLELMTSGGRRQFDTKAILEYYDLRMSIVAFGDFLLLGHGATGSYALADSKTSMFALAADAYMDIAASPFNRKAIPQLMRLNGMDPTRPPKLVHGDMETIDLGELGGYVERLGRAGISLIASDADLQYLREQAGMPGTLEV